ncbi:MAG: DUF5677 domain-containing protein [Limisphaerales bacterium]
MSSSFEPSPELTDCLKELRSMLEQFIGLDDALIAVLVEHESAKHLRSEQTSIPNPVVQVIPLLLQAIGSSSHTLLQLSKEPGLQTRDCYSICRSIVELAVNICFIISEGADAAERALRHARQKAFRELECESKIGNNVIKTAFTGRPDPSTVPGLQEEIEEFTSNKGREKNWIDDNVKERIAVVGKHQGEIIQNRLHTAHMMVHSDSSEVLHGSLFSALHFFGATEPSGKPRTLQKLAEHIGRQHMVILFAANIAMCEVFESFHKEYGFSAAQAKADAIMERLQNIAYLNQNEGGVSPKQEV